AVIAGNTVSIDAGSVDNSGAIAAADGMTINATDIKANGGVFLAGGNMNLNATNGITLAAQTMNIGGQTVVASNGGITAGGNLKVDAGAGGLTLSGTKVAAGGSAQLSGQTVTVGAVKQDNGGTQALIGTTVKTGGNLSIAGTSGVNIIASSAKVGGDLSVLSSNGSVNIISAGVENTVLTKDRLSLAQGGTITTTTSQIQQGSSLIAGGSMLVSGNQGVLIAGSTLDAKGNLGIISTNGNVAITASEDQTTSQSKTIPGVATGYKGGSSSSTAVTSNGSSISSGNGNVTVEADAGNVSVIGSDIAAKGGTANLIAKGDITIGEATDSASSASKSGSKKASEATTTAEGSSIAGQTGVNIASTGGNVTISASDVTAGDATHTANANISAAGNVVIASGKDTDEATSDSKSSGFLSSSKTHTHTYDENTIGSSVSASGNVNVAANGETVVSGSSIAAGNNLSLSGSTVTVMAAEEEHESDKQTKKSGIGVGSGGGFISIYGSKDSKSSQSETDNIGSTLTSGGTTTITSTQGDVNIFGSSSHSGDGTVISSARDVNIAPGAEEQSSSSQTKRSGFGINFSVGSGSVSVGIGVGTSEEKRSKDANINAVSTLDSDGSITIAANRNINDQSGKILAAGPIGIIAGDNVNMLSSNDVTNASEMQKKSFAGVSITVQSSLISAGQQAMQAGSLLSGNNGIYGIAPAVLAGVKGYQAITSTMAAIDAKPNPDTGLKPAIAGISLTAGYSFSESSQQWTTSIPVPPEISGSSVTIIAQSGDVVGRGVQITAGMGKDGKTPPLSSDPDNGSVLISAGGNVDLESVQATSDSKSSSKSGSVSVGVGASIDANRNIFNAGPTANAAYSSGKETSNSVTQVNSNVSGTGTVTVVAGDTLTLAGGVLSGKTVNATAANGIVIESRQDTASYDEKSKSAQLGISSGGISGGYNQGTITGDYANVSQQSGIFAGSGGYHVNTDGTIELVGGFIGSSADPKNNDLTANQILYSNIENSMSASSTSYGFSLIGAGIPVPVVGQPAKQDDHGETLATITPGTWSLTGQSQDLSGLNTDASKANSTVDPFDIDKLKAQQQSAAALSALLNMGVGELSDRLGFAEGSSEKVALHAAVGAIVSQVAGTNVGAGALGGALSEIANGVLQQVLQADPNLTDTQKSAISQWVAAAVGAAAGGGTGAAAALDNVNYNYLTHKEAKELELAELACRGGSDKDCKRHDELLDLSQARDDQLQSCVGNSSSECVQARIDLRIAAAEYVDAALTGDGNYVTPIGSLQRQWALLQAYDYADDSDLGQITDADRIAAGFKTDEAKALLTASKSGLSAALRSEILYGVISLGANGTSGKVPTTGSGSKGEPIDEGVGSAPVVGRSGSTAGSVADANFAQTSIRSDRTFSREGRDIYSELAGYPIRTVDDLSSALRKGDISPANVPVDFVDMNGTRLILNTRTSTALQDAGIPQSQWYGTQRSGQIAYTDGAGNAVTYNDLATNQLKNNGLPLSGSPTLPGGL
ncbi:hemagglutinin repeat-containing protein, partial [Rhizobium leucaenae]